MNRRRSDDVAAIAAQIDSLRQAGTIPGETARVSEVEMAPAATSDCLHRGG